MPIHANNICARALLLGCDLVTLTLQYHHYKRINPTRLITHSDASIQTLCTVWGISSLRIVLRFESLSH